MQAFQDRKEAGQPDAEGGKDDVKGGRERKLRAGEVEGVEGERHDAQAAKPLLSACPA